MINEVGKIAAMANVADHRCFHHLWDRLAGDPGGGNERDEDEDQIRDV
jgi:hypothetical protein